MKPLLVLLAVPLLLAATFGPWENEVTQQPVEQQTPGGDTQPDQSLWVVNNTGCAWDADDRRSTGFLDGVIAAGETATGTRCVIADGTGHGVWFNVQARSPDLIVETRFEPQGFVFRANPVATGSGYEYWICTVGPDYDQSAVPTLPEIAGSNGGHGVRTDITVSITNPTSRTIRKVHTFMRLAVEPEVASGGRCAAPFSSLGVFPGPFIQWKTS